MPFNCTISYESFLPYLQALLNSRHLDADAFNIDNVPPPPEFVQLYAIVAQNSFVAEPIYVIFNGNHIGVTTDQNICRGALVNFANSYRLRARSLVRAYSMWRYWLRLLVTTAFERDDLGFELERVVQVARVRLPRASEVEAEIPVEVHPSAPVSFAPVSFAQPVLDVSFDISESDSASSGGESEARSGDASPLDGTDAGLADSRSVSVESDAEVEEVEHMIVVV